MGILNPKSKYYQYYQINPKFQVQKEKGIFGEEINGNILKLVEIEIDWNMLREIYGNCGERNRLKFVEIGGRLLDLIFDFILW